MREISQLEPMLLGEWPCSPGTIDAVTASKNREACHSAWVINQTARDEVARKSTRKHASSQPKGDNYAPRPPQKNKPTRKPASSQPMPSETKKKTKARPCTTMTRRPIKRIQQKIGGPRKRLRLLLLRSAWRFPPEKRRSLRLVPKKRLRSWSCSLKGP